MQVCLPTTLPCEEDAVKVPWWTRGGRGMVRGIKAEEWRQAASNGNGASKYLE